MDCSEEPCSLISCLTPVIAEDDCGEGKVYDRAASGCHDDRKNAVLTVGLSSLPLEKILRPLILEEDDR